MRISPFGQAYLRKRATDLMDDACIIYNPGEPVLDRSTGKVTTPYTETKYEGPCRFWEVQAGQTIMVGEEQLTLTQSYLSLPFDAPVPESEDTVEITASVDPSLVGTTVSVISVVHGGGLRASRKLLVQVVESPEAGW